jgi:TolB protein
MPATAVRRAIFAVCIAAGWLLTVRGPLITVRQGDPHRSPRGPRTVDISADGRSVAFESLARLVPADADEGSDIYVLDRTTGRVTLESGGEPGAHSHPRISGDGRYVVFETRPPQDVTAGIEIRLLDRQTGRSRALTTMAAIDARPGRSRSPDISDDGRVVAFSSISTSLVGGPDANGALEDVFVVDLPAGTITRASVSSAGAQPAIGESMLPALSSDGRWLAFASTAPLDGVQSVSSAGAQRPVRQVYLRDLSTGRTRSVTRPAGGGLPNGDSSYPAISADGRFVAFVSEASNLVEGDGNRADDVVLFDRVLEVLSAVSRGAHGGPTAGDSTAPDVSGDGRFVAFQSDAGNLVCARRCSEHAEDINLLWDVFLADRSTGRIVRLSEDELGGWMEPSAGPALDGSGSVVAFSSRHPVDAADRREDYDLFIRAPGDGAAARFLPLVVHTNERLQHRAAAHRARMR